MFLIVKLNFFTQSNPSRGAISFLCYKCLHFLLVVFVLIFAGIFLRNFTSFLFTSWYRCPTFWISVFKMFSSAGIEISDPVSIIHSFSVRSFSLLLSGMFLSVILFIFSIRYMLASDSSDSSPITVVFSSVTFLIFRL